MAFLSINGWTIPVARGGDMKVDEIGERTRSFDGTALSDIRASKRAWKFETPMLREMTALAIRKLIRGEGHVWPFDADLYSSKGLHETSGAAVYTLRSKTAADSEAVDSEAKFSGAVAFEPAATNLLGADSRDAESAPTGYTALNGATLASSANAWQGNASLSVTTDAVGGDQEGAFATCDPGAGSAGKTYTGSVYLRGASGGEEVSVWVRDATNGASGTATTVTLASADTWYRVEASITIGALDCRVLGLYVCESLADSGVTFYADGWQLEEGDHATSWADGSRAACSPAVYSSSVWPASSEVTIAAWFRSPTVVPSTDRTMVETADASAANGLSLRQRTSGDLEGTVTVSGSDYTVSTTTPVDGAWHHVALVLRPHAESSEHELELYLDGVSVDSDDTMASAPDLSGCDCYVGDSSAGSQPFDGLIDDLAILPYAAPATFVAAIYGLGEALPLLPRIQAEGDFAEAAVTVEGKIDGESFGGVMDGVWRNNARSIKFELAEV